MKFSDRNVSAWRKFGFVLTALTIVPAVGFVVATSELADDGISIGWLFLCFIPLFVGMLAYMARRHWLAGRLSWHSIEPEGRILLWPLAVVVSAVLIAASGLIFDARFALSRGAFERAVRSGATFNDYEGERWIGLYKVHAVQIDKLGRAAFNVGYCGIFAYCELEFDATTPCKERGWREYRDVGKHWCVIAHETF